MWWLKPLHVTLSIVAAIVTFVAVFAIKRGVEWELQGASSETLDVLLFLFTGSLLVAGTWLWVLRPLIERRKQRQQPGLPERAVRDRSVD